MTSGKNTWQHLMQLPEAHCGWFKPKGFPEGKLGRMIPEMHEMKINGLEYLLHPLVK